MSRATMFVKFPDGEIRYGIYNGTSDIARTDLFETLDQAWNNRSQPANWADWAEGEGEPVDVATNYGGGFSWKATATKDFLTSGHDPYELDSYSPDFPDWAKNWQDS